MMDKAGDNPLQIEFKKRIHAMGISRREFERRSGLSRQTIYNIEVLGASNLRDSTYTALDRELEWTNGTARALASHAITSPDQIDTLDVSERESVYRWRIVERLVSMHMDELVRVMALMDRKTSTMVGPREVG